ncbi:MULTISPECIES: FxDxF family PEP-CTERM protein [Janthinobacterium]|uniref:PEP-CTERM sorting domain-containing protein n=1 Tax=Janthinobacterium violaceinigrum TaxID=2654252 RepID=A0A6I1HS27_9BURK|nr:MULTISPECIES: FxDxF family PEP-CTERM protein [Janthinobacterium]KAB8057002.1 PEP-CTERM sorting domain-containing protein [Janthinobacterium sp. FT14W]KAB8060680.1 PEP-CTERM sorting domain-containing protein [Janthinobacterium violaceinigrum]MED5598938.1 FxDxF family PEP-CTERM protein [Janthinobacterium sp. P210006]
MKLKFIAAGILAAASFSASAATYDLGILDPSGSDTLSAITTKFTAGALVDDFWTFKLVTPSSTSFGALQTFSVVEGAIQDFSATLLGYGSLTNSTAAGVQSLSWTGPLAAGEYTVHVTGLTGLAKAQYLGSVSALPVPEPETYGMLLGGLALVGFAARRARKAV